jgi:hypothetical protein
MRFIGIALLGLASAGCLGQGGTVMLTVSQANGVTPAVSDFNSSDATANVGTDNVIHFTASSGSVALTMDIQGPIAQGQMIDLAAAHNFISFDVPGAGWASNGGQLAVDGTGPYRLRFITVPMLPGSGAAKGSFVFDGSGTFK